MRTRITGCALLLGLLLPMAARAQATGRISGVVTSDAGQPVPNAQITVPANLLRAITDSVGRYTIINVPAGFRTVRATSLGHSPQEVTVTVTAGATATQDFKLGVAAAKLAEVVVVGYGEQRAATITGSVASVSSEEFVPGPSRDAAQALAGKVAGLGIITPNGDPRRGSEIQLRGVTTVQGSRNPLILIDGVPGSLETVPSSDIESISVLKDGSAAAIYGARASNGVILISTKRHTGGKPTIRYEGFASQQTIYHRPEFLDAADYRRLIAGGTSYTDLGSNTDWQQQILRSPVSQHHYVSVGGGDVATNYTAALTFDNSEGIFLRSDNQEVTARGDIRHAMFSGKLDIDFSFLNREQNYFNGPDFNAAWRQALIHNPTDQVKTADGLWQERGTYMYWNPVGMIEEENGNVENRDTRIHGTVNLHPIDNLRFSLLTGISRGSGLGGSATTFKHFNTTLNALNGTASRNTSSSEDRILQGTGTYYSSFGSNNVTLLGGYSYQDFLNESFNASNSQFPTDLFGFDQLQQGTALTDGKASLGSDKSSYKTVSFFSRVNYDWQNRLLLMASVNQEGNSRFGADHKWGVFPAVSGAWRLSEEGFMRKFPFISDLKVRTGYGVTGIAPSSSYLSLTSYRYQDKFLYNGVWVQGLRPARNANPDLRWEEKHEVNTGVDFALFESRLSGTVDVYRRETRDMLYSYAVPTPPNLFNSTLANVGTMQNNGVEAQLSFDVIRGRNFQWTTNANWSTNTNKLKSLSNKIFTTADCQTQGGTGEPIQTSTHRVCVGEPIGNFYGWKSVGIDDKGEWLILGKADTIIPVRAAKDADKRNLGNGLPKQYAAWNNNFRFRGFDAEVNMRGAFQYQILNFMRMYYENPKITQYNMLKTAFDNVYGKRPVNYDLAYVSYYIENGDYVKLDNATLGYTIPSRLFSRFGAAVTGARVFFTGRNLLTMTGYKGMDPEVSTTGLAPGNDNRDQYPTTRTFTAGFSLTF